MDVLRKSLSVQRHPLTLPSSWPPTLTVVIDTEEEFDWNAPFDSTSRSTTNIKCQSLAQTIMERHGVVPTYVVDYPVAETEASSAVLRSIADRDCCEIGAHLHPWVTPPYEEVVNVYNSFPGNLKPELEREKLHNLSDRILTTFGQRPTIYKAGRYGLGSASFGIMKELGFQVDASIVPFTDFSAQGGPNFQEFSTSPFRSESGVIAIPLSVHFVGMIARLGRTVFPHLTSAAADTLRIRGIAARAGLLERLRLSPEGHSLSDMVRQTQAALARGERHFMLTYHSSSLLPGATAYVRSEDERRQFLYALDRYFSFFRHECGGLFERISAVSGALQMATL